MGRLKLILRIGGTLCFAGGVMCMPLGYGVSPKGDLSVFVNLADMHAFIKIGLLLMAGGAVAFMASLVLPGEAEWDDAQP
jgi:hypothetical protein